MKTALKLIAFCVLILSALIVHSEPYKKDTLSPDQKKQLVEWIPKIDKDLKECDYLRQRVGYLETALNLNKKLLITSEQRLTEEAARNSVLKSDLNRQKIKKHRWFAATIGATIFIFRNQILNTIR